MLLQTRGIASRAPPFVIGAAGQRYNETVQFIYLGGVIHEDADLMVEIRQRVRLMRACYGRFSPELNDMATARLSLKVHLLKAEVIETLLYGCVTWTLNATHYEELRKAHLEVLRRVLGFQRRADHTNLSYANALKKARCKRIETTIRKRRLFFAGAKWYGKTRGDFSVG